MNFEALSLIHELLAKHKEDTSAKVKELGKEFAAFHKRSPFAADSEFERHDELTAAKEAFDTACRVLREFNAVNWHGGC